MKDIYDLQGRLNRVLKNIQNSKEISSANKELLIRFSNDMFAEGLSIARVLFYMNRLWNIARWIKKDFKEVKEEDLKEIVKRIAQMNYSERTKVDYNSTLKKFFKWLNPSLDLNWLRTWVKMKDRKLPEEILTNENILEMIKACHNVRDKAIISVLYESGARVGEFLGIRIKNVQFDKYGAVIVVHGKNGWRRIRLVSSVPHLSNWIEHIPLKIILKHPYGLG